jgi:hypothetical protein
MVSVRKVYLSLISFMMIIVIMGTATFAWLGLPTENSVDGLGLTATTGNHLEISLDGVEFGSSIDIDQLEEIFGNARLHDITTIDGENFYFGGLNDAERANPNEHYISFDLWFRTSRRGRHIFLVNNVNEEATYEEGVPGTYVVSKGTSWTATHTFLNGPELQNIVEEGARGIYYAADAIRISVIERLDPNNVFDVREENELQRLIYDPSENPERGFGVAFGAFSYLIAKTGLSSFRLPQQYPNTVYSLTEFQSHNPYQAVDNNSLVAELIENGEFDAEERPYYQAKVSINIWIEGWDADAFDAVVRDRIKVQLEFMLGFKDGIN